jgi:hypothetical protein
VWAPSPRGLPARLQFTAPAPGVLANDEGGGAATSTVGRMVDAVAVGGDTGEAVAGPLTLSLSTSTPLFAHSETRGPRQKPGASSYTLKRPSLSVSHSETVCPGVR